MNRPGRGAFRSLGDRNYRMWAAGAPVSNVCAWMQRIAQDWLVLTQLGAPLVGWVDDAFGARSVLRR